MHSAWPLLLASLALLAAGLIPNAAASIAFISAALAGLYAFKAPFWAVPTLFLSRATAAVSVAAINSIGNLGGFVGPYAIGLIKDLTGNPMGGLVFLAALLMVSFAMMATPGIASAIKPVPVRAKASITPRSALISSTLKERTLPPAAGHLV